MKSKSDLVMGIVLLSTFVLLFLGANVAQPVAVAIGGILLGRYLANR